MVLLLLLVVSYYAEWLSTKLATTASDPQVHSCCSCNRKGEKTPTLTFHGVGPRQDKVSFVLVWFAKSTNVGLTPLLIFAGTLSTHDVLFLVIATRNRVALPTYPLTYLVT